MNEVSIYFRQSSKKEEVKEKPPIENIENDITIPEVTPLSESDESVVVEKSKFEIESDIESEKPVIESEKPAVIKIESEKPVIKTVIKPVDAKSWTAGDWNTSSNYKTKDTIVYKRFDSSHSHGSWSKRKYGERTETSSNDQRNRSNSRSNGRNDRRYNDNRSNNRNSFEI